MARSAKVKRPTIKPVKPSRMKADRKPVIAKKPAEPAIPDTKEDLLAAIGIVLDKVDAKMATEREFNVMFGAWDKLLRDETEEMGRLTDRLNKLLNPNYPKNGMEESPELIQATFGAPPGEIPAWSRPGTFLLWIDYVPVRCIWGGFADPQAETVAADPNVRWLSPAGAKEVPKLISANHKTPADLFRNVLRQSTTAVTSVQKRGKGRQTFPHFDLFVLSDLGKEAAQKVLDESPWLVAALRRGPVDPIPLPRHLSAVQMTMWG